MLMRIHAPRAHADTTLPYVHQVDKVTSYLEAAFKAERNVIAAMLECKVGMSV